MNAELLLMSFPTVLARGNRLLPDGLDPRGEPLARDALRADLSKDQVIAMTDCFSLFLSS